MGIRDFDYKFLPIRDAHTSINQKVNIIGVVFEFGFPKPTRGTDYCCTLRIIDETHHQNGMSVNIFAENAERLPRLAAVGDIIQLCLVMVKTYGGEVNAVFNKKFSSFALYKGTDGDDLVPYQVSSKFHPRDEDKMFIAKLRKWLVNFQFCEDTSDFPMLREIKGGHLNLVCKILHCCEAAKDEWFFFVWDGTDSPPNTICAKLEDETNSPLPLHLEPSPLSRELLCTLPTVGSILRITFDVGIEKNHLHLLNIGKWIKFINMRLEVHAGLWRGVFTPFTKLRYTPNEDCLIIERQRLYDERKSLKLGRMPSCSFPKPSCVTEAKHDHVRHVTLMDVLTHSEVTAKFKCVVRMVAVMPCQAEKIRSPAGTYRMQLTLEDPTARIHAFVVAEDGETLFDGYPAADILTRKLNRLLGVTECDDIRNPPWVSICLKSYYVSKTDVWGSRHFRIFDTKIAEAS
ncbi:protection of telomeres protein 1b [Gastrolobium bilobum]|uniref:protection of telomeres protein 1b n=1 Tax=Gastrolobium bilobum TaxID=150636 RepID=UPI002AB2DA12|nr:protection of telomeres protein 1b [Gastrolobium bilobum]